MNLVTEFSTLGIEMRGETKKHKNALTNTACALRKQDGAINGISMQQYKLTFLAFSLLDFCTLSLFHI